jgi:hypothetical protein
MFSCYHIINWTRWLNDFVQVLLALERIEQDEEPTYEVGKNFGILISSGSIHVPDSSLLSCSNCLFWRPIWSLVDWTSMIYTERWDWILTICRMRFEIPCTSLPPSILFVLSCFFFFCYQNCCASSTNFILSNYFMSWKLPQKAMSSLAIVTLHHSYSDRNY